MKITVLTLFPEYFDGFLNTSIISRHVKRGSSSSKPWIFVHSPSRNMAMWMILPMEAERGWS